LTKPENALPNSHLNVFQDCGVLVERKQAKTGQNLVALQPQKNSRPRQTPLEQRHSGHDGHVKEKPQKKERLRIVYMSNYHELSTSFSIYQPTNPKQPLLFLGGQQKHIHCRCTALRLDEYFLQTAPVTKCTKF
jgi:hypothetical protein